MIGLLINLALLCIIFGVIYYVLSVMPLPEPFGNLARILVLVVFLLMCLSYLLGYVPMVNLR